MLCGRSTRTSQGERWPLNLCLLSVAQEPYPQILKRAPDHSAAGLALARLRLAAGEVGEGATLCEKVLMAGEWWCAVLPSPLPNLFRIRADENCGS